MHIFWHILQRWWGVFLKQLSRGFAQPAGVATSLSNTARFFHSVILIRVTPLSVRLKQIDWMIYFYFPQSCSQGDPLLCLLTLGSRWPRRDSSVPGGEKAPDKWVWLVLSNQSSPLVLSVFLTTPPYWQGSSAEVTADHPRKCRKVSAFVASQSLHTGFDHCTFSQWASSLSISLIYCVLVCQWAGIWSHHEARECKETLQVWVSFCLLIRSPCQAMIWLTTK